MQLDPKVKHFSRLSSVMAEMGAADVDPDAFPVLLDAQGNVSESVGANFFVVSNGVLMTSGDNSVLQGVSRTTVQELVDQLGIPTSEEDLQPYDAYNADEAFLSSTPYCVLPVARVDNRAIGSQAPGSVTRQLLAAWSEMVGLDLVDQAVRRARSVESSSG